LWQRKRDEKGNLYLLRDARWANPAEDADSQVAHQIQFLNLARATIKILELQKQYAADDSSKKEIEQNINAIKYKVSQQQLGMVNLEVLAQAKDSFVKILKDGGVAEPDKALNFAKDFVTMDDRQYNIATLTEASFAKKRVVIVECNNMLTGLTKSQRQEYQNIASGQVDFLVGLGGKDKEAYCAWYTSLPESSRKLVAHYALRIANGSIKMLPTQLLDQLKGLRNAYCKSTHTVEVQEGLDAVMHKSHAKLKPDLTSYHCGTVSFLGKGNAQSVTDENVRQLQTFLLDKTQKLSLGVLNSPRWGKEKRITAQAIAAAKNTGQVCSVTPINGWRGWLANNNKVQLNYLRLLAERLAHDPDLAVKATCKYLKSGRETDRRNALKLIGKAPLKLGKELRHMIEAKKLIQSATSTLGRIAMAFWDPENTNLQIAARMGMVEAAIENGKIGKKLGEEGNRLFPKLVNKCKSGKDRTGGKEFLKTVYATCDKLDIDSTDAEVMKSKEVLFNVVKPLIDGQHTQTLAAINGGTPGAYGIKKEGIPKVSDSFLPKSWQKNLKGLEQSTAKLNKISKYKKSNKTAGDYIADRDMENAALVTDREAHKAVVAEIAKKVEVEMKGSRGFHVKALSKRANLQREEKGSGDHIGFIK
jgi:hypothetical protein